MICLHLSFMLGKKRVPEKKLTYIIGSDLVYTLESYTLYYVPMVIVFNYRTFRTPLLLKLLKETKKYIFTILKTWTLPAPYRCRSSAHPTAEYRAACRSSSAQAGTLPELGTGRSSTSWRRNPSFSGVGQSDPASCVRLWWRRRGRYPCIWLGLVTRISLSTFQGSSSQIRSNSTRLNCGWLLAVFVSRGYSGKHLCLVRFGIYSGNHLWFVRFGSYSGKHLCFVRCGICSLHLCDFFRSRCVQIWGSMRHILLL